MSQRGRGSGRGGDDFDPENQGAADEQPDDGVLLPPLSARPIAPYDPYRPRSADAPRMPSRGGETYGAPRRATRSSGDDPFLPDDDPLNADAWQLELDEAVVVDDESDFPDAERDLPPPPRRARRQPATSGSNRDPAAAPRQPRRARARTATARTGATRPAVSIGMPRAVTGSPLVADQTALILLGVSAASIVLMALVLAVRLGAIASPTVLHLDAAGNPDRWGPASVLWRLPLISLFSTVMFLVVAWFLYPTDRFGARFALAIPIIVQIIAWVAVIQHIG